MTTPAAKDNRGDELRDTRVTTLVRSDRVVYPLIRRCHEAAERMSHGRGRWGDEQVIWCLRFW